MHRVPGKQQRQGLGRAIVLGAVFAQAAPSAIPTALQSCATVEVCLASVARMQDPRVTGALDGIDGTGPQLVALHAYLRALPALAQRWSWSDTQIQAFAGSGHQRDLDAAIDGVRREFERANPGYTLTVNPQVRSLDRQLRAWNSNRSVAEAGTEFLAAITAAVRSSGGLSPQAFARMVTQHKPRPMPALAAPGLSRHGQMYAVDFHVRKTDGTPVADTDTATIAPVWMAGGWEGKLHAAVVDSGTPLKGPLGTPPEPWHYDYEPARAEARAPAAH